MYIICELDLWKRNKKLAQTYASISIFSGLEQGIHREDQAKKNQIQDPGVQSDGIEGKSQSGLV